MPVRTRYGGTSQLCHPHSSFASRLSLVRPTSCAEQIRKTADLTGIHVVDKETQWIMKADEDVTNGASLMLIQGMETQVLI